MIPNPLGFRLDSSRSIREQIREAAKLGAKGVVIEAIGELAPSRLSETGRREFRHILRSVELGLIALSLPVRRPFDTTDQLEDRLNRADSAFAMAYELGTPMVLAQVGAIPAEADALPRQTYQDAVRELGSRADHRGTRLAIETGPSSGTDVRSFLDHLANPGLAASIDPAGLLQQSHDPVATVLALGPWVAHAYANAAPEGVSLARRPGFASGTIDWAEYLGALEEINYRGYLTIWPDPNRDPSKQFQTLAARLKTF